MDTLAYDGADPASESLPASIPDAVDEKDVAEITEEEDWIATSAFAPTGPTTIALAVGDVVEVMIRGPVWWYGRNTTQESTGYFPPAYITTVSSLANETTDWQDDEYYGAYGVLKIHCEMLADVPRTEGYRTAIESAKGFVAGKVVMDVGCGTGILSIFAARAGARHVYAVEASSIAAGTRKIVDDNGLSDVITVLNQRVEDIELPEKVDLILSEWMGTFLVFEYMIDSVLRARDKWMRPGGVMWPSSAQLFLVPIDAKAAHHSVIGCWADQFGVDMHALQEEATVEFASRPRYDYEIAPADMLADPAKILEIETGSMGHDVLESFTSAVDFEVSRASEMHAFGSWFDVAFALPDAANADVTVLSTGPGQPLTHWKQDLLLLDLPIALVRGDRVQGTVTATRNKEFRRHLTIKVVFVVVHAGQDAEDPAVTKEWKLWR